MSKRRIILGTGILATVIIGGALALFLAPGVLSVEAQIIYNFGGAQPMARQEFYVLNADPAHMPSAAINEQAATVFQAWLAVMSLYKTNPATLRATETRLKEDLRNLPLTRPYWQSSVVATLQTDFKGLGQVRGLRPGQYWLMGAAETRAGYAFWTLPFQIRALRTTHLALDQNNALFSK